MADASTLVRLVSACKEARDALTDFRKEHGGYAPTDELGALADRFHSALDDLERWIRQRDS